MIFDELRNNIDFFIRNKTKFSRKNYIETNKSVLERALSENLYMTELLSQNFSKCRKKAIRTLDIGCKNWYYAKGQYDFYKTLADDIFMDGIELDAYRLYSNFYTRYEVARFYIKDIKNANFIADDLMNLKEKYDYITWILPFVFVEPLKYWGLPKKYFSPMKLLDHAYSLLNSNGQMLIINQGEEEALAQKELLNSLNINYIELGKIENTFFEYKYERYGFLITKN